MLKILDALSGRKNYRLLGAIAGDVIGSVYEFNPIKTTEFELFSNDSTFTDDTVLTMATAAAILDGEDYAYQYKLWGLMYPNAGYGSMFLQWLHSKEIKPYGSYGNGSAMRVHAIGWAYETLTATLIAAEKSSSVTHDHSEGIKGAQATAGSIFLARKGATKEHIRDFVSSIGYRMDKTLDQIRPTYRFDVTCQGSVPQSIQAFLESSDYESAVRNAVSLGGDADTMGCIAGGIAEAFYGGVPKHVETHVMKLLTPEMHKLLADFTRWAVEGKPCND